MQFIVSHKEKTIIRKILVTIICLASWSTFTFAQVAVIAHKSVPVDEIKKSKLLDFYTGDIKSWSNGVPVVIIDLKPKGEVKDTFYKFLGKTSSRMKLIWLRKMLSGEGRPPESLITETEMLKKVATSPGAIGFVHLSKVNTDVKILLVIEKEEK